MTRSSAGSAVDVAIPTYGRVPYLRGAIESVLAQTHQNWRLTLVDNSEGGGEAEEIITPFLSDPRVHHVTGGGHTAAENWTRSIRIGDAPYVALLHDDDLWEPEFLARRVAFLDAHPECGFVFSNYREIDADGEEIAPRAPRLSEGVHQPEEFVPRQVQGNTVPQCAILVRRSAYEEVGPEFLGRFKMTMDSEMWMRIAVRYPVGFLNVRDCSLRFHGESISSAASGWGQERLAFLDRAEELIRAHRPGLAVSNRLHRRKRSGVLLTCALDAAQDGNRAAALRFYRRALRTYPKSFVDPRTPVIPAVVALGERGGRGLQRLREFQRRHHIRAHGGEIKLLLNDLLARPQVPRNR